MIVLDTHIWIWWVSNDARLSGRIAGVLRSNEKSGLGVSAISCWEVAKAVESKKLVLPCSVDLWFTQALGYPGLVLLPLTPRIAAESASLPQPFHRDPGDQMIVATARVFDCPLLTADSKILAYPDVRHA